MNRKFAFIGVWLTCLLVGGITLFGLPYSDDNLANVDDSNQKSAVKAVDNLNDINTQLTNGISVQQKAGTTNDVNVVGGSMSLTGNFPSYPVVLSATSTGLTTNAMIRDAVTNTTYCVDIYNNHASQALCVNWGTSATTSVFSYKIPAGEARRLPPAPSKIYGICADGTSTNSAVVTTYNVTAP